MTDNQRNDRKQTQENDGGLAFTNIFQSLDNSLETTEPLFVSSQVSIEKLVDRIQQHSVVCSHKLQTDTFIQRGHVVIISF